MAKEDTILKSVEDIRQNAPGVGAYKLWLMLTSTLGRSFMPGRDSFFQILARNNLMLPPRKKKHTTNSNHRFRKWKNLIKGLQPLKANQLWVSDITYISLADGDVCYLHLITDAYSHKIVGWKLARTLRVCETLDALNQAIEDALQTTGTNDLEGLIHHSDRGIQYCCDQYVNKLHEYKIKISMTEDYKPTDNAIAERINGIIKTETSYNKRPFNDYDEALKLISEYINFYNNKRPHMSIGHKIPAVVHRQEEGLQEKRWKNKVYISKSDNKSVTSQP